MRNAKKRTENEKLPELKSTAAVPVFTKRMAAISRSFEKLKKAADGLARQRSYSALLLSDDFRELERSPFATQHGGDFRAFLEFSTKLSAQLHQTSKAASFDAKKFGDLMKELAQNCTRCHEQFRN